MEKMQTEKRIIFAIIVALTLIASGLICYSIRTNNSSIDDCISTSKDLHNTSGAEIIESYEKFSNFIFDAIVNSDEVTKLMYEANLAEVSDEAELSSIREELYDKLIDCYETLTKYSFRQLQFHLSNGDSFLRFNSPEKYGDNLTEIRPSVRIANEEERYVSGFEGGRIFNGYRFVYPLSYDDMHVGSVEISVSMESILAIMSKAYPDLSLGFILRKDLVESTVFEEDMQRYNPCYLSDDYVIDEDVYAFMMNNPNNLALYQDEAFMQSLSDRIGALVEKQESFTSLLAYNGNNYVIQFEVVRNTADESAGYMFFVVVDDNIKTIKKARNSQIILILTVYLLLMGVLFSAKRAQNKINALAMRDPLTKAYNRYAFFEFAHKEAAGSERTNKPICFALLDIDFFKTVNDKYGHIEGDSVLKTMVNIAESSIRKTDVLGRYGGEEFILMFSETDLAEGIEVSERIRTNIEKYNFANVGSITVSIGLAQKRKDERIDQAIDRADKAMYFAKNNGRNQVRSETDII